VIRRASTEDRHEEEQVKFNPMQAPTDYPALRTHLLQKLGYPNEWRPLLIAVDGRDGAGKSAVASWLAWQLDMPAFQLDIYVLPGLPIRWQTDELRKALTLKLENAAL
jgi:hypothetical protein